MKHKNVSNSVCSSERQTSRLDYYSVMSCLHSRARRAKWQVEFLPEKCSHAGPLCLLLSLRFPSFDSAAFSLLFGADAAAMFCYCGRRKSERPTDTHTPTHTYSLTPIQQECAWKKTQKLLAAYHFFLCTFFSSVGVPRDRGRGQKGWEGDRGWGNPCDWEKASPVTSTRPSSFHFQLKHAHISRKEIDRGVKL